MVYKISYKTLINAKPLSIRFDKVKGFIRVYNGTRYLVLLGSEKYHVIYNGIRYLIGVKLGITCVFFHNKSRIKVDLYKYLSSEEKLTFHNAIVLLKSVFNADLA